MVPVPLRYLKLSPSGEFHPVFQLLPWLDHPETMGEMKLHVFRCTVEDISGTIGLYVRDYIRRDGRTRDGLAIHIASGINFVSIQASTISSVAGSIRKTEFAKFTAALQGDLSQSEGDKLSIDFVAHTPREHVIYFHGNLGMDAVRKTVTAMPNLQGLHISDPELADGLLQPDLSRPLANKKPFPSLRRLPSGKSHFTRRGLGSSHLPPDSSDIWRPGDFTSAHLWGMKGLVEELVLDMTLNGRYPWRYCSLKRVKRVILM